MILKKAVIYAVICFHSTIFCIHTSSRVHVYALLESELKLCNPQKSWDLLSWCQSGEPEKSHLRLADLCSAQWPQAFININYSNLRLTRAPAAPRRPLVSLVALKGLRTIMSNVKWWNDMEIQENVQNRSPFEVVVLLGVYLRKYCRLRFVKDDDRNLEVKTLWRFDLRLMALDGYELIISQLYLLSSWIYYALVRSLDWFKRLFKA